MRRIGSVLTLAAMIVAGTQAAVHACTTLRSSARIDAFACDCQSQEGNLATQIYVVSGSAEIVNHMATPTLGSLVVELQAREGTAYVPVARQLVNGPGSTTVETCDGSLSAGAAGTVGPVDGRCVLVDGAGAELVFDDVKSIPDGTVTLRYLATFAGNIPELAAGERARVKIYVTASDADHVGLCTVDSDGDGASNADVITLTYLNSVRVPATSSLVTP